MNPRTKIRFHLKGMKFGQVRQESPDYFTKTPVLVL